MTEIVRPPSRNTHPVEYNLWWERTPDSHLQGCEAACEIARYLIQVFEAREGVENKFENRFLRPDENIETRTDQKLI